MGMQIWHLKQRGVERGPFRRSEIKKMVRAGDISPHDLLRKLDDQRWRPAGASRKLFVEVPHRSDWRLWLLGLAAILLAVVALATTPWSDSHQWFVESAGFPAVLSLCITSAIASGILVILMVALPPRLVARPKTPKHTSARKADQLVDGLGPPTDPPWVAPDQADEPSQRQAEATDQPSSASDDLDGEDAIWHDSSAAQVRRGVRTLTAVAITSLVWLTLGWLVWMRFATTPIT